MQEPRSAEELYQQLGFGIGEGPFRIKGSGYLFHYRWVEELLPGGVAAQRRALGPLGEHEFFDQIFMAGTMYDLFPLVALGYACAAERNESFRDFVVMRAGYQAEQDLRHIRKLLVRIASPVAVAKRFPSILTSYFDFGTPVTETFEGGLRGIVRDVPQILGPWMIATCEGFARHALGVNGARGIRIDAAVVPGEKTDRGMRLADLRFDFSWE